MIVIAIPNPCDLNANAIKQIAAAVTNHWNARARVHPPA